MLQQLKLPVVNLRLTSLDVPFPYVGVNHAKVSAMAAEHLLSLGLKNFGFFGRPRGLNPGLDQRADAFVAAIKAAGFACDSHQQ